MIILANILKNTPVSALITAKPSERNSFICLGENDTIRSALNIFITQEIDSIPIRNSFSKTIEFFGIISLPNLIKFVVKMKKDLSVSALLDMELAHVIKNVDLIKRVEFISAESSLLHILLNVWGKNCNPKTTNIDCSHLITTNEQGMHEIVTPLDFLRHILLLSSSATTCIQTTSAAEIENGFDVDKNFVISWNDDAKFAFEKIINSEPVYLLAVVDEDSGALEANITISDLLPSDETLLDEAISMMKRDGISIHAYLKTLKSAPISSIDPILLYPHFTIYDLIEKLTCSKIHHLWRVTPDTKKIPIGAVGSSDILRYLSFMFRPFKQDSSDYTRECENLSLY